MDSERWAERNRMRAERHRERMERWAGRHEERMRRRHANPASGMIFGIAIIAVGVLFLLQNLGIVYFADVWQFWPMILIALGVSKLISPTGVPQVTGGLVLTAIGTLFLLRNLDIIYVNVWQFVWPVIIIAAGVSMLARHLEFWDVPAAPSGAAAASSADRLKVDVVFSGTERKIISQDFQGGKIAAVFGGAEIDLREAVTKKQQLVIQADAVFGGVDLWVPSTWRTDVQGSGVFGAYEDQTHPPVDSSAPLLIVKGGAVFGSVTVKN
jgi:predicted membrane protein